MPKILPHRWANECVREFRESARRRYDDGVALAGQGRRTGAIYVWGYSAEMTLKAAYFSLLGIGEATTLTWGGNILPAINHGRTNRGIVWPHHGQGHNVRAWAELLVAERAATPGAAYTAPFDTQVQTRGQRIGRLWSETLRYHKNLAYPHEMNQVRNAVEWLLANSDML